MAVFLDTNFYLSLVHIKDANAKRGGDILQEISTGKYGLLYTSNFVIVETATLVAVRTLGNPIILKDLEELIWGENKLAEVLRVTSDNEKRIWELFVKINTNFKTKKDFLSFVDVSNIILAEEYQITKIVSFDQHFDGFMDRLY